ncbi:hypothetical protein L6164_036533 [Bauhinia variegata]|uniref:Uncharacterized protein n=1 Tax=Bauhinia variegata TaxID=167791 RepID=A0ACB9KHF6_BAUVA|nr:hypothetical protein L6164_036533 [Bauhinia variegata]
MLNSTFHKLITTIMGFSCYMYLVNVLLLLSSIYFDLNSAKSTLTSAQFIRDPVIITSDNDAFRLGFFSPNNTSNRYVGIWYLDESNVIWVANKFDPVKDSSGIFTIYEDGNLVVLNELKQVVWSSNVSTVASNSTAQLLDSGNLILIDGTTGDTVWESFQHPSDTMVPKMKLSSNKITGKKMRVSSWKSLSDPSTGFYSLTLERLNAPELIFWVNESRPYWRSGPWNGKIFIGSLAMSTTGWSVGNEEDGSVYLVFNFPDNSSFTTVGLDPQGKFKFAYWNKRLENKDNKRVKRVIIAVAVIVGTIALAACAYLSWKLTAKQTGSRKKMIKDKTQVKLEELPLVSFEKLATATNNFHSSNMLGRGGFGVVYKGKLQDGQEIAVKMLSRASVQGLEQFMNEVAVISKLQHRNLIKLIGCCAEGEEKMLIYEFMPNKSLDTFLFDPIQKSVLDWRKRYDIIEGVARGLLYLHKDSRLKIIHRDLKASNILLDGQMNPKISDFGLARIFKDNEDQVNTRRVMGTYGYMPPEYAMKGLFSEKSDVYSFGVLLLEIVNGKRNTSFYDNEETLSLVEFAWKLWNEDNIISLIDQDIANSGYENQILRCIQIGLLCVQEVARERPTMTAVVSMLSNESVNLPPPRQVAFIPPRKNLWSEESQQPYSINSVTVTDMQGR